MDLKTLLNPFNETNILFLIGATGVGKTTLIKRLIRVVAEKLQPECDNNPSTVSLIFISAPANGEKSLSWVSVYEKVLKASNEILIEKKQANVVENGIMTVQPRKYKNLPALRDALESMLKERKVRVLAIDEAYHMLRFGNYTAVMDTLKQIADLTKVKLLLIGSYNLLDLACDYGQVSRRAEILHFERYHHDCDTDKKQFSTIVEKIQKNWPSEIVPEFRAISKELMDASLGCIGLLKALMLRALAMQLDNRGKWDPMFLPKAAKSMKLLEKIRAEIEEGEEKIKGATYGESLFTGKYLTDAIAKMNLDTANV
jgi:Cdc6-like AAA superfamily ATPase